MFPEAGLASDIVVPAEEYLWLPSKSPLINFNLGGGIPFGKMIELLGEESSGKSLLAMDFIKSAQELDGVGVLVDAEFSFEERWASLNGLDLDELYLYQEITVERIHDFIKAVALEYREKLVNNEPIVVVVDSLAALDTEEALKKTAMDTKAEMGIRAKKIYAMVRQLNPFLAKLGVITIFVNQLRDKVGAGMFEDSETSPGGKAMRFYASQRIGLYSKAGLYDGSGSKKHLYGKNISFRIKKNKVAPPRSPHNTQVIFDENYGEVGFTKYEGLRELLLELETIEKRGNAYYFDGEQIATGKDDFMDQIQDDDELYLDLLDESPLNTIDKCQERLEQQTKNRYEVKG